jgi:hypothetical protein
MVQAEGSSSKAEALQVRGRTENRNNNYNNYNRDKSKTDRGRSKSKGRDGKFCKYCKKTSHNIDDCWKLQNKEKRNGTYQPKNKSEGDGKAAVVSSDNSDGDCLVVFLVMMSGSLILHVRFIFAVTKTGSVLMSLCRVEMLCIWEITTHVRSWALAPFRSRCMMA